jgi:hypothetical protein
METTPLHAKFVAADQSITDPIPGISILKLQLSDAVS